MELTVHAIERIYDRTEMRPKDVLSVISGGAVVDLGMDNKGRQYFLFYSPNDNDAKVAVVSMGPTRVITILKSGYILPRGVKRVTRRLKEEARALLQKFVLARINANRPLSESPEAV